eukprot:5797834-Pleurochrysis_carterae.AAC.2
MRNVCRSKSENHETEWTGGGSLRTRLWCPSVSDEERPRGEEGERRRARVLADARVKMARTDQRGHSQGSR